MTDFRLTLLPTHHRQIPIVTMTQQVSSSAWHLCRLIAVVDYLSEVKGLNLN